MKVLLHDVTCRYVRSMWHLSSRRCWHLARGAVPYWSYCAVLRRGDNDVKVWFDSTSLWSASYKIYISRSTLKQKTRHKKWTLKKKHLSTNRLVVSNVCFIFPYIRNNHPNWNHQSVSYFFPNWWFPNIIDLPNCRENIWVCLKMGYIPNYSHLKTG